MTPTPRGRLLRRAAASSSNGAAPLLFLLLAGLLAACTERGDFGRPRPSVLADAAAPALGAELAALRGEPVSPFVHTDDETELRRRAWRFLMPSEEEGLADHALADAVRTRILPRTAYHPDPDAYYAGLMSGPFRSPASRYRRLGEDAVADALLLTPFTDVALRVLEADRVRLAVLGRVRGRPAEQVGEATARVAENRCLIAWVREAAAGRARAYRGALDHLVVEAPQGEAVNAERALRRFEADLGILHALPGGAVTCSGVALPEARPAPLPVVAKG